MDEIYAIRFDRFQQLLWGDRFNGKQAAFAAAVGKPANYISRIANRSKKLGEELVREFEDSLGIPPYWFDQRDKTGGWPFPTIDPLRYNQLTPEQRRGVEQWVAKQVDAYVVDATDKSSIRKAS